MTETFLAELRKRNPSEAIIILDLNVAQVQDYFITDSAGIWKVDFRGIYAEHDTELTQDVPTKNITEITTVQINGSFINRVTTYTNTVSGRASALAAEASFIYDTANDILYLRLEDYEPPWTTVIKIGVATKLSTLSLVDTVDDIYYRPDMLNAPNFPEIKDKIFFESQQYYQFVQRLANSDGRYDTLAEYNIWGQKVFYKVGFKDIPVADYEPIYEGRVTSYEYSGNELRLTIKDERKSLSVKLPQNQVNTTTYPDMSDQYNNSSLPLMYGFNYFVKCIPTDDQDATPTSFTFKICDTEYHSIKNSGYTIEVNSSSVTPTSFDNATATFVLSTSQYVPGDLVTFTGQGYIDGSSNNIENPLDIIEDLLLNYLSIQYNSSTFDTAEWELEKAKAANIGLFIDKQSEIFNWIEKIATTLAGGFLFTRDGKYTFRTFDADNEPVAEIQAHEWFNDIRLSGDSSEVLSSAIVKYGQAKSNNIWKRYINNDFKDSVFNEFSQYKEQTFDTLYYQESDAEDFSNDIMERSKDLPVIISGNAPIRLIEAKVGQNIEIDTTLINNRDEEILPKSGLLKCEVLEISPDIDRLITTLRLRKIESIDYFQFCIDGGQYNTDYTNIDIWDGGLYNSNYDETEIIDGTNINDIYDGGMYDISSSSDIIDAGAYNTTTTELLDFEGV